MYSHSDLVGWGVPDSLHQGTSLLQCHSLAYNHTTMEIMWSGSRGTCTKIGLASPILQFTSLRQQAFVGPE